MNFKLPDGKQKKLIKKPPAQFLEKAAGLNARIKHLLRGIYIENCARLIVSLYYVFYYNTVK
jgi:hypothetical protein